MAHLEISRLDPGPQVESSPLWKASYEIRRRVFIEEQQVPPELELEYERDSCHYLAEADGRPCGCGRWRRTLEGYKIERVAVLPIYRGLSVGREIMKRILSDLRALAATPVYLASQIHAAPFYEKLGFRIEGPPFREAGIEHVKMVWRGPQG